MGKKEYKFNHETLSYEEVKEPLRLRLYRLARKAVVVFIVICIANLLYSLLYYTPKTQRLEREEGELLLGYMVLNERIDIASAKLAELKERDNNIYRLIFAADTLSIDGIYTPYPDSRYEYMEGKPYSEVMIPTWKKLDAASRSLYLQSLSLDELQQLSVDKKALALSVPAIWPIDIRNVRKIDHYGSRIHPIYKKRIMHHGIDLGAHTGDPVYAVANGVVKKTDKGMRRVGYGQQILIDHGFGYQTRYTHLSSIDVVPGQEIKRGEHIGKVGSTGGSTGPHLHYEIIYMGKTVNPINYLKRDIDESEFEKIIEAANTATFETKFQ